MSHKKGLPPQLTIIKPLVPPESKNPGEEEKSLMKMQGDLEEIFPQECVEKEFQKELADFRHLLFGVHRVL